MKVTIEIPDANIRAMRATLLGLVQAAHGEAEEGAGFLRGCFEMERRMSNQTIGRWKFDRPEWNGGRIYMAESGDCVITQPDHEGDVEIEVSESGYFGGNFARTFVPIELMRQLVADYDAAQTEKAAKTNEGSGG